MREILGECKNSFAYCSMYSNGPFTAVTYLPPAAAKMNDFGIFFRGFIKENTKKFIYNNFYITVEKPYFTVVVISCLNIDGCER